GVGLAILVAAGALIGILATRNSSTKPPTKIGVSIGNMATLPGIQLGKPPWNRGQAKFEQRLAVLGIQVLSQEALQVHYHPHLDVYVNGKPVTVPQAIGRNVKGGKVQSLAVLHTH